MVHESFRFSVGAFFFLVAKLQKLMFNHNIHMKSKTREECERLFVLFSSVTFGWQKIQDNA